jgi:hypothetical protein
MTQPFDSPEAAAMNGFPPAYCRVVASVAHGNYACVLLDTRTHEAPYLYGVSCRREKDGWIELGSSNGFGWTQTDAGGSLSFWGEAPTAADRVRVKFRGTVEERGFPSRLSDDVVGRA